MSDADDLVSDFVVSDADDLVSDFIVSDDVEVEPLVDPVADGDDVLPLLDPLADGDDVLLLESLVDGGLVLVSVPVADGELPVPPPLMPVPPALPDELPALLPEPLGPCASAGAAANARATATANAPVNVFIAVSPCYVIGLGFPAGHQLAWRRSATGLRKSCSAGGASTRAILGSVTGRPSRAER
jgi:hypothetical protein